jgi:hypothetical protein
VAVPLGVPLVGARSGRSDLRCRKLHWLAPLASAAVALPVSVLLRTWAAAHALGVAVVVWFVTLVGVGILEVIVYPEGRLGV